MNEETQGAVGRLERLTIGQFYRAAQAGNLAMDAVLADIKTVLAIATSSDQSRVERLETALKRQCDNMVFLVNHADLGTCYDKFKAEVEEDQLALGDRS